ncbi:MAG: PAS domain-containing protein [Desulfarculus sp.]|nr:PAS domain-containing protein [Desulfarculus sp.]
MALTVLDLEGRLLFYNRHAPKILDRQPGYLGRDVGELHQPASRAKLAAILAAYRDGDLRERAWKLPRGDKTFAVRVAPLVLDGRISGLVHAVLLLPPAGDPER